MSARSRCSMSSRKFAHHVFRRVFDFDFFVALRMPLFQIISDVHLEFPLRAAAPPVLPVLAPAIALLGDIGYPKDPAYCAFVREQAAKFEKVFIVAGNHVRTVL